MRFFLIRPEELRALGLPREVEHAVLGEVSSRLGARFHLWVAAQLIAAMALMAGVTELAASQSLAMRLVLVGAAMIVVLGVGGSAAARFAAVTRDVLRERGLSEPGRSRP